MNRRTLLGILLLLQACSGGTGDGFASPPPETRPNIVLIVADDLGFADLGVQGSPDVLSPHIDAIAAQGVRFTAGYVSAPDCSPTRAGMLTGRYQQRFGHERSPRRPSPPGVGLPLEEITLADKLKDAGYATGLVGKWHLGTDPEFHPLNRGFDEFFGFLWGKHSYLDWSSDATNPILRGFEPVVESTYLTEAITREAVSFIDRHRGAPFFLCLAYNAVHEPMETPPTRYLDRFPAATEPQRKTLLAMLAAMDDGVGKVMDKLRAAGILENTLVIFLSDNGGPTSVNTSRNLPLRGEKTELWEGGIRVPFLLQWNGRVPAGRVYENPVIQLDIFSTALAAARVEPQDDKVIDGVDLVPYLSGERDGAPHGELFWRYGTPSAVRKGQWKLLRTGGVPPKLFDLLSDPGETTDLASKQPEIASELDADLSAWKAELISPRW
jgi:arylsulfatase A-like enzyme